MEMVDDSGISHYTEIQKSTVASEEQTYGTHQMVAVFLSCAPADMYESLSRGVVDSVC